MMMGGIFGKKKYNWGDPQAPVEGMPQAGAGVGMPGLGAMQQPDQPKKPGFFKSDRGRAAIGTFADTLIRLRSGVNPGIMDNMRYGQDKQFAEAQYERKRTDAFQDAMRLKEYEMANPSPTALQKDLDYYQGLDDAGKQALGELYDIKTPKFITGADGRPYQMGRTGGYGGELDSQPTVEDGMAYTPGPGGRANPSNWKAGGGSGNTTGNFPR